MTKEEYDASVEIISEWLPGYQGTDEVKAAISSLMGGLVDTAAMNSRLAAFAGTVTGAVRQLQI